MNERELRYLRMMADGMTNVEIAYAEHKSAKTVKNQVSQLFVKLDARCRTHAVAIALRQGIIA